MGVLDKLSDIIGLMGVTLILLSYFLLNTNKISAQSIFYQLQNLIGASFILFSLCFHWNTASFVVESAWISISCIGIFRILYKRKFLNSN